MTKAKKVKVFSYAKFQAIILGIVGILFGLGYSIGGTIIDLQTIGLNRGTALAYMAIPLMPLYFAIFGFISGLVGAVLYNVVAKFFKTDLNFEKK